jgi:DNA-binding LacI/PurR family transcriptional regulator
MNATFEIAQLDRGRGKKKPLYQQIGHHLRQKIEAGEIARGQRLPPISEMVNRFKVDYRTISLALNLLESEQVIRLDGGRARGPMVVRGAANKLAMAFMRWDNDAMALDITRGINRYAREKSLECMVIDSSRSHQGYIDAISHPIEGVGGIILVPHQQPEYEEKIRAVVERGIKVVFVDRFLENVPVSSVTTDHVAGAYEATSHLLDTHGIPVYFITSTAAESPSSCRDRAHGWRTAMSEHGIVDASPYILEIPYKNGLSGFYADQLDAFRDKAMQLFQETKESTYSILCATDVIATGVYQAAEEFGLQIGKDVFVVGFGDMPLCKNLSVPLSSVNQTDEQVGYEAAKLLHMSCAGTLPHPIHRILPCELQIRCSSMGIK